MRMQLSVRSLRNVDNNTRTAIVTTNTSLQSMRHLVDQIVEAPTLSDLCGLSTIGVRHRVRRARALNLGWSSFLHESSHKENDLGPRLPDQEA